MEQQIISLVCLIVGYILGVYPNRKNNIQECYSDMKGLVDAYSNLCVQMFNQNACGNQRIPEQPLLGFPFSESKKEEVNAEEEMFDLRGGTL